MAQGLDRSATVLRSGKLAMMGAAMIGKTSEGKTATFVATSLSSSDSESNSQNPVVTGILWKDSAVSKITKMPVATATCVMNCQCRFIENQDGTGRGLCISVDANDPARKEEIDFHWMDTKRSCLLGRALWEVDGVSAASGQPMSSFADIVGTLSLEVAFVCVHEYAIDSCQSARESLVGM